MRQFLQFILLTLIAVPVFGQKLDRTNPPPAGPAPEIRIGEYKSFTLDNGLKVFVVNNSKIPMVSFTLQLDRDPVLEGEKAGMLSIYGGLMSRGTATRSKAEIDEAVDFIGASFGTTSDAMSGSCLTKHVDELLVIMQDVLLNPIFPEDELEKLKKQSVADIAAGRKDPTTIVNNVRNAVVYGKDHPYGEIATEQSIANVTAADCASYYKKYWTPKNSYLAIVGDIDDVTAKELAKKYFGSWKGGEMPESVYRKPQLPESRIIALVDRPESVQSAIRIAYPLDIRVSDEDYLAARLVNQILGGGWNTRLLDNLREDKGYTYSVGSRISADEVIGSFSAGCNVRNEVTEAAVKELIYELGRIAVSGVTEAELNSAKAYLTGGFARAMEDPSTVAAFAINIATKDLPQDFYHEYLKNLNNVTLEQVNKAALKYIQPNNCYIVVVGKAAEIADGLAGYGNLVYYDMDGNPDAQAGAGRQENEVVSPDAIIEKYLSALGGREALNKVSNLTSVWKADFWGSDLRLNETRTSSGGFYRQISINGSENKVIISENGKTFSRKDGQGAWNDMDSQASAFYSASKTLWPELHYKELGVKLEMMGEDEVGGRLTNHIRVTFPDGLVIDQYYDKYDGLKLREVTAAEFTGEASADDVLILGYIEKDGINLPSSYGVIQPGGQMMLAENVSHALNTKVDPAIFTRK